CCGVGVAYLDIAEKRRAYGGPHGCLRGERGLQYNFCAKTGLAGLRYGCLGESRKERRMPHVSRDQFWGGDIIFSEGEIWVAQGVQFDITARGRTPTEASERFNDKFGAELVMSLEIGEKPLAGVGSAPKEFWDMYENAKMRAAIDDAPIRLSDGATPYVHQEIKIADRRRAA